MLREVDIQAAAIFLSEQVNKARSEGRVNTSYGLHGLLTLLHHRIQRWLDETDEDRRIDEVAGIAGDALVALALSVPLCPDVDDDTLETICQEEQQRHEQLEALFTDDEPDELNPNSRTPTQAVSEE